MSKRNKLEIIGRNLSSFRHKAQLTQAALARLTTISAHDLARFEQGRKRPTDGQLSELGGVLGYPASAFESESPPDRDISLIRDVFRILVVPHVPVRARLIEEAALAMRDLNYLHRTGGSIGAQREDAVSERSQSAMAVIGRLEQILVAMEPRAQGEAMGWIDLVRAHLRVLSAILAGEKH